MCVFRFTFFSIKIGVSYKYSDLQIVLIFFLKIAQFYATKISFHIDLREICMHDFYI